MPRATRHHRKTPDRKIYTKGQEHKTFSIRVPIEIWKTLNVLADQSNRSLNGMVNWILEQVLKRKADVVKSATKLPSELNMEEDGDEI